MRFLSLITVVLSVTINPSFSQSPFDLPLFDIEQLFYHGAFRLPADTYGNSSLNYSQGPIEYNVDNHSIFIVGHTYEQAIAEFNIPPLINSTDIFDLNIAQNPIQPFSSVLDRALSGNNENINRIGGMEYVKTIDGNRLLVNAYEYYDAPADNTVSTISIQNANDIANSQVNGYYSYNANAGHTSGWISPIPQEWKETFQGDYITGNSSGIPIIGRCSVGPSAFSVSKSDIIEPSSNVINSQVLLDFNLENRLHEDLSNLSLTNDLWTHLSRVNYGFIIPGTRTYFTIGKSGGHFSGVCYKCIQDDGNTCGGYCAPEADDNYQYYWLWDLIDLYHVLQGNLLPHEVLPYDYGIFDSPFQNGFKSIGGGTFDPSSNTLYLSIQRADRDQGTYSNPPIIVAYKPIIGNILPVKRELYKIEENNGQIIISGQNFEIEYLDHYNFYKLDKAQNWNEIGIIKDKQLNESKFKFVDYHPHTGENEYKLIGMNKNGVTIETEYLSIELENQIDIFPNPALNNVRCSWSEKSSYTKILILSLTGHLLKEIPLELDSKEININVSNFNDGFYILRLENNYYSINKKLIISR